MKTLPKLLRPFFWDVDFASVSWTRHRSFIARRLLAAGDAAAVEWLREKMGDEPIRALVVATKARGLALSRVSRWISRDLYEQWIAEDPNRSIWSPS